MFDDSQAEPTPKHDPFGPPAISTVVHCLHCGEEYDSYRIEWRVELIDGKKHGFWCCPIEGCSGCGFGFDIYPVDPEYRDENGNLMWCSDASEDDDEDYDDGDDNDWTNDPDQRLNRPDDKNWNPDEDIPF